MDNHQYPQIFTNNPTSYIVIYKVWELYDLSLFGKLPERGGDWVVVSFLSLGAMTGREVEVGITH